MTSAVASDDYGVVRVLVMGVFSILVVGVVILVVGVAKIRILLVPRTTVCSVLHVSLMYVQCLHTCLCH